MMPKRSLSDFCLLIVDCEHKTAPTAATGYASIRTPNIGRGRLILEDVNRVDEPTYRVWTKRAIPRADDLIIAREAPVGNVAIIPRGLEVCLGQRTVLARPDPGQVDPRFLCYFLLGEYVQGRFQAAATGATVPHLNMRDIRNLSIPPLPDLKTQRRIGSILGAYDELIEVNLRRITALEEMARRPFDEWFVRFRFPGHEQQELLDTAEGPPPHGWRWARLGDVARINAISIRSDTAPDRIAYVDIASVSRGVIERVEEISFADAPGRARRTVRDGSVIWSMVRPNRRSFALILDPPPNLVVSTGFAVLDAIGVPFAYLYQWVTTPSFVAFLTGNTTGAAYPAVTPPVFERARIAIPEASLLTAYQQHAEPVLRLANSLREANHRLTASRDLLLPRLVSGELSVVAAECELKAAE